MRLLAFIAGPVLMSVLFGSLFGGLQNAETPAALIGGAGPPVLVPVYDAGESQIVRLLHASERYDVRSLASPQAIQSALIEEGLGAGLILPEGFDAALMEGSHPTLQLMVDAHDPDSGAVLQSWLSHALWDRVGQPFPSTITVETFYPSQPKASSQRQEQTALWLVMSLVTVGVYVVPALLIEEKETRTLEMILVTPASYRSVILAKAATGLVYSLLASGLILALNSGFGSGAAWVALMLLMGALVLVGVGLLLGGLFDDMATLNTWSTLIMLVLMLPGMFYGLVTSGLFRLEGLRQLVRLLPTHYVLEGIYAGLDGPGGAGQAGLALMVLAGAAGLLLVLDVAVLRRWEA